MSNPTNIVIWLFLAIFAATAIIALAALPQKGLQIQPAFRKPLFWLLIAEVLGVVVVFGRTAFSNINVNPSDLRATLISQEGWDWQYAEEGWRSAVYFSQGIDNKLNFKARTRVVNEKGKGATVIDWESTKPFDIPAGAKEVVFEAKRKYTPAAAGLIRDVESEIGKDVVTTIRLRPQLALRGTADDPNDKKWQLSIVEGW